MLGIVLRNTVSITFLYKNYCNFSHLMKNKKYNFITFKNNK